MSSIGQHFGDAVKARRQELELSQIDVWQAGGPSNTMLTTIENGRMERLTRTTARKLDIGLRWEPGSARRVWQGGDPAALLPGVRPKDSARLREIIAAAEQLDEAERAELRRRLDSA